MRNRVEILAPAGSYDSLKAAIAAGADAVYIGGTRFGARAFADNLTEEKLLEVIDYVHLHGRKIYLTVNTLLKEYELSDELYNYLLPYYRQGIDAVIVQDLGVLQFIKEHFPDLPIHASTQMTITNVSGAKFMESQGVERVVTAREMNIQEIKEISENTNLEIESFVHGALCYCYSGQCLYSSLIGGRSGNRGQCAQPCRLPYRVLSEKHNAMSKNEQYILSLKDMCTLEYIPELIEAGIYSFKIEGRMKKPEYVALVTSMYRKYVDLYFLCAEEKGKKDSIKYTFKIEAKDKEKLLDLYNRGGFHGGYYHRQNGRDMISIDRPNHAGVPAVKVLKYNGRELTGKALVDIAVGDIIELPDIKLSNLELSVPKKDVKTEKRDIKTEKKDFKTENYTFTTDVKKGQSFSIFMKRRLNISKDMILRRTRNESLITAINETIINRKIKEKIKGKLILSEGLSAKLSLEYGEIQIEVHGKEVQTAKNQPINIAAVEKQMKKTGNTEFEFEKLEIEICGNGFMPTQSLNELRRMGLEALEKKILSEFRRNADEKLECLPYNKQKTQTGVIETYVYVEEMEQFQAVLENGSVRRIYVDANIMQHIWDNLETADMIRRAHTAGKEIYFGFPHIFRSYTKKSYESHYTEFIEAGWDGVLVRNLETCQFLLDHCYSGKIVTDYNVFHFNQYAKKFWENQGADSFTAPYELNYRELKRLGISNGELIIYGYQPMMVSAQCIVNTVRGCQRKKGRIEFVDRYNKTFCTKNLCDYCYNIIYNTSPLVLFDQKKEIEELMPKAVRLHFTIETAEETTKVLEWYQKVFEETPGRQIDSELNEFDFSFTRGHFKRGVN